ncbi:MAG: ATP-binding cassette domain-containing protein, partial [Alsobacter sp.]
MTSLLSVTGVETAYGPVRAVQGVSFSVDRGKVVAILGANGAGKTTLMRTISGTLVASTGEVHFDGRAIQGLDPDRIVTLGLSHVPEGRQVFP